MFIDQGLAAVLAAIIGGVFAIISVQIKRTKDSAEEASRVANQTHNQIKNLENFIVDIKQNNSNTANMIETHTTNSNKAINNYFTSMEQSKKLIVNIFNNAYLVVYDYDIETAESCLMRDCCQLELLLTLEKYLNSKLLQELKEFCRNVCTRISSRSAGNIKSYLLQSLPQLRKNYDYYIKAIDESTK